MPDIFARLGAARHGRAAAGGRRQRARLAHAHAAARHEACAVAARRALQGAATATIHGAQTAAIVRPAVRGRGEGWRRADR
eukprot:2273149-Prymnesium_polylepis.1